ncbi:hypothetical protein BDZ94DRAFT_1158833 [Collybia nuda]|uniref:DUF6593 domain-containing protein n=1 Tax=Collybia nuda TaxID=64659 RepID=A0A9P5YCE2_9AGAR|nr:hypothetical protein BDZ94DRAFT_1158833 [Collybia nuda]
MILTLSNASPLNSLYLARDGRVQFKVETKIASSSKTSTRISKVSCAGLRPKVAGTGDCDSEIVGPKDVFTHMADIEYNAQLSPVLRYQGRDINTEDYFRRETWGECGRHRIFTGPDGREYRWLMSTCTPELIVNDKAKTLAARFNRPDRGSATKSQQASLKIFPPGEFMVETILVTLLYIEMEQVRHRKRMVHTSVFKRHLLESGISKPRSMARKNLELKSRQLNATMRLCSSL